jgi:TatD DNase family protein
MNPLLADSHCHLDCLDLTKYHGNLSNALAFAKENHVGHFLCVCIDLQNVSKVIAVAEAYPNVSASVGVHPNEAVEQEPTIEQLLALANHPKVVAIGETGLDYYRSQGDLTWQHDRFRVHIRAAKQARKPLIIHTREAREDTIRIMREENVAEVGGVMHCFTETWEMAQQAMDLNFYISISGVVTFKNATELQNLAQKIPLDRMLIETDSPYLAPMPFRGKPNEPAYVYYVAKKIAELRGESFEKIADLTTRNYFTCFQIPYE